MSDKTRRLLIIILTAVFAVIFVFAAYKLAGYIIENKKADASFDKISEEFVNSGDGNKDSKDPAPPEMEVDFDRIPVTGGRTSSWITIRNTAVNYPIVQGSDNDYYLNRLPDGTKNKNGSIFMDFRNAADFSDHNTFIYGHHMKSGAMFAAITEYSDQTFYEEHPYLFIITPDKVYRGEIFSAYVAPASSDSFDMVFNNQSEFEVYLETVAGLSNIYTAVEVSSADRIVTLSTCTYEYDDARFLVHAKLVDITEEMN